MYLMKFCNSCNPDQQYVFIDLQAALLYQRNDLKTINLPKLLISWKSWIFFHLRLLKMYLFTSKLLSNKEDTKEDKYCVSRRKSLFVVSYKKLNSNRASRKTNRKKIRGSYKRHWNM